MQLCLFPVAVIAASVLVLCNSLAYKRPRFSPLEIDAPFVEQFIEGQTASWISSQATKVIPPTAEDASLPTTELQYSGQWAVLEPSVYPSLIGDLGLAITQPARLYAISRAFNAPIAPLNQTLILQYELKTQDGLDCGGAYIKLLSRQGNNDAYAPERLDNSAPFSIMFGPDICGDKDRVHFIFRHKNPQTGAFEEKHMKNPPAIKKTKLTTHYALVVRPDNSFEVRINRETVKSGNLLEDFEPPVNPPKEIADPRDLKPTDWDDEAKIPDPNAVKPADWDESEPLVKDDPNAQKPADWLDDEPEMVPDPQASKPASWIDAEDGEWKAPLVPNPRCSRGCGVWRPAKIRNPKYRGPWKPSLVDNPRYRGPWSPKRIDNPNYFYDAHPHNFEPMVAAGFELWTMQAGIFFDNILVTFDEKQAAEFTDATWSIKYKLEKDLLDAALRKEADEPAGSGTDGSAIDYMVGEVVLFIEAVRQNPREAFRSSPVLSLVFCLATLGMAWWIKRIISSLRKSEDEKHCASGKGEEDTTAVLHIEKTALVEPPEPNASEAAVFSDSESFSANDIDGIELVGLAALSNHSTPRKRVRSSQTSTPSQPRSLSADP